MFSLSQIYCSADALYGFLGQSLRLRAVCSHQETNGFLGNRVLKALEYGFPPTVQSIQDDAPNNSQRQVVVSISHLEV